MNKSGVNRLNSHRTFKRIKYVFGEGLNHAIRPLTGMALSLVVIKLSSPDLWGEAVPIIIGVELVFSIINWGNRYFLLMSFSDKPHQIDQSFLAAFIGRLPILALTLPFAFLLFDSELALYILIWVISRYASYSFDPVVQFERKYKLALGIEIVGFLCMTTTLFWPYSDDISLLLIVQAMAFGFLAKGILFLISFRFILRNVFRIRRFEAMDFLKKSAPFLLLTLTGLFQSRVDLYAVNWLMKEREVAHYQVLISFLAFAQTASILLVNPFVKNIVRLNSKSIKKVKSYYLIIGAILSAVLLLIIHLVLLYVYEIQLNTLQYGFCYLYIIITYTYTVQTLTLLKSNHTHYLSLICFGATILTFICCLLTIPEWGVSGALFSAIVSRVLTSVATIKLEQKVRQSMQPAMGQTSPLNNQANQK